MWHIREELEVCVGVCAFVYEPVCVRMVMCINTEEKAEKFSNSHKNEFTNAISKKFVYQDIVIGKH